MQDRKLDSAGKTAACVLAMKAGRLHLRLADRDDWIAASAVYLRPLSARSEVAFFDDDAHELLTLESLDELAPTCRKLAETQLAKRYHMPKILRIESIEPTFGTHYWRVETDKGSRAFAFKEPGKNVTQLGEDRLILRDTMGNRYEIRAVSRLDGNSRRQLEKIF